AEFNIKRGAITAEFGRAAGFVANAVSKSGSNELHGAARLDWLPQGLIGDFEDNTFRDPLLTTVLSPTLGVGGPFVPGKLVRYGPARYIKEERGGNRTNQAGQPLPDESRTGHELYAKLTATPSARHLLAASFRDRPTDLEHANLNAGTAPSRSTTEHNASRIATAAWSFFPTGRTTVDVKYLYLLERNESTPDTALGYLQTPFNAANPALSGQYTNPTLANLVTGGYEYGQRVNYTRHEARAVFSQYLDI